MFLRGSLLLAVLLAPSTTAATSDAWLPVEAAVRTAAADDLESLEKAFRAACRRPKLDARVAALSELLALGDMKAMPGLVAELASADAKRRLTGQEIEELEAEIHRDERLLKGLRTRAERDESLKNTVANTEARLREKNNILQLKQQNQELHDGWVTALSSGISDTLNALPVSKRKGVVRQFEKDAKKHAMVDVRLAAVVLLGYTAEARTAVNLQGYMAKAVQDRDKAAKKLPKLETESAKYEQRMQKEMDETGGVSQATVDQYNAARREATVLREVLQSAGDFADACTIAARRILERAEGDALIATLGEFQKRVEKAKGSVRLRTLRMLGTANADPVRRHLRIVLAGLQEPASIAQTLDDLAALGDTGLETLLIERYLVHESWHVRARAAAALATLRSRAGVPALIARLESAEGRERTDVQKALMSLTGKNFRSNHTLWQRWWDDAGADFEVATAEELAAIEAKEEDGEGVTFFGIRTESQRVVFILDTSGSMNWSTVVRSNAYDDPNKPPDLPRGTEKSRLEVAKGDLKKAIGGLRDGAVFNIVTYATEVRRWKDDLQVMTPEIRAEVLDYISDLEAVGGTNIFGSLKEAFTIAGVDTERSNGVWTAPAVDTIFLLTDGTATAGTVTENDGILSHVEEWNRAAGIVLHTIGLSGAQDAYLLGNLAERNNGEYVAH